jgi:hypothetical protein
MFCRETGMTLLLPSSFKRYPNALPFFDITLDKKQQYGHDGTICEHCKIKAK